MLNATAFIIPVAILIAESQETLQLRQPPPVEPTLGPALQPATASPEIVPPPLVKPGYKQTEPVPLVPSVNAEPSPAAPEGSTPPPARLASPQDFKAATDNSGPAKNSGQSVSTSNYLSIAVLAFGAMVNVFVFIIILWRGLVWDYYSIVAFTIPLVIFAGLFLLTAGYTEQQVAPMFGLLGTIIGYLMGSRATATPAQEQSGQQ